MGSVKKGTDFNLYIPINGVNYPLCHATDCKITFTGDTQETTTRSGLRGKTFNPTGKYSYTVQLNGITAIGDLPAIARINGKLAETITPTFVDANSQYKDNGTVIDTISFFTTPNSGTYLQPAGHTGSFIATVILDTNPPGSYMTQKVVKNGVVQYYQSIAATTGAQLVYTAYPNNSDIYDWEVDSFSSNPGITPVNIPDSASANHGIINVSMFQDALLQGTKLNFIFTDQNDLQYTGTVLVTQSDLDSPVDNVSTFVHSLLGDGDITKVTTGVPPIGTAVVFIKDQFGGTVAVVQAPGTYTITKFDTIDCRGWANPDLIITSQT